MRVCTACLVSGKTGPPPAPPLQPPQWPAGPLEHIQMDICWELRGVPHHDSSLWPMTCTLSGQRRSLLGQSPHRQVFLEVLFACWGMPTTISTDNGPQFISADFTTFLSEWRIRHIRTAFYNPQANGGVERMNKTLKNGIRGHIAEGFQFSAVLLRTLLHYRATRHTTTDSSPALLMLGRELSLPLDRLRVPAHLTSQGA